MSLLRFGHEVNSNSGAVIAGVVTFRYVDKAELSNRTAISMLKLLKINSLQSELGWRSGCTLPLQ